MLRSERIRLSAIDGGEMNYINGDYLLTGEGGYTASPRGSAQPRAESLQMLITTDT